MNRKYMSLILASAVALTAAACTPSQRATTLPPGEYEKTTSTTDARGTTYEKKQTTDVGYDANGNKTATVKTETTKDPKGLFNKTTHESTSTSTAPY